MSAIWPFAPDGTRIAIGGDLKSQVNRVSDGALERLWSGEAIAIDFSPDGEGIVTVASCEDFNSSCGTARIQAPCTTGGTGLEGLDRVIDRSGPCTSGVAVTEPAEITGEKGGLTSDGMPREAELEFGDDPVVACFKKDVDRSLLIDNLLRTYDERARRMNEFLRAREQLQASLPSRTCST